TESLSQPENRDGVKTGEKKAERRCRRGEGEQDKRRRRTRQEEKEDKTRGEGGDSVCRRKERVAFPGGVGSASRQGLSGIHAFVSLCLSFPLFRSTLCVAEV
ncbi:hypothetical protein TGRUB_300285, partial [Toxoplasma gondii RUB]